MLDGYSTTLASGYGGQNIFLVPELDLMMVTTARSDLANQPDSVYSDPYEIFARHIIPAVKAAPPSIPEGGVVDAAGYGARLAPGSFASVFGSGLSLATETWEESMPADGRFPEGLGGVMLRIGGRVAYPSFVSPGQVNFLVPADLRPGRHRLELSTPQGRASQEVEVAEVAPALFTFERNGKLWAAARSARPGERIELWASGLGAADPAPPAGAVLGSHLPLVTKPEVLVGGRSAQVVYAALAFAGVYQLNIQIPEGLAPGLASVQVRVGSLASPAEVALDIAP